MTASEADGITRDAMGRSPMSMIALLSGVIAGHRGNDLQVLTVGGAIATYATDADTPAIPFWPLLFKNSRVCFVGSDDFPPQVKTAAARDLNEALTAGWSGFEIAERIPLDDIATAHERVEVPVMRGRVIVVP